MATTLDSYAPYDSGPGSNVTEDGWRLFAKHWRGDGVIRSGSAGTSNNNFAVFGDSTGMQVKVPTGECWIQGNWGRTTTTKTLAITAAHATLGRRDLVVLRNDFVNNRVEVDVKTGTPNASPVYPSLTQNSAMWEIQLGKVVVGAAVVTITAGNVTSIQTFTDGSCRYTIDTGYQTLTTNTDTRVDFDTSIYDSSEIVRPSIHEFQITRAGFWQIQFNVQFDVNGTGNRSAYILRQGSSSRMGFVSVGASSGFVTALNVGCMDRFTSGTIIEAWAFQSSGGNLQVTGSPSGFDGTNISMYWLGP
jgi:hypothetical protein